MANSKSLPIFIGIPCSLIFFLYKSCALLGLRIYNEFGNTAQGFAFGNPDTDGIEEAHNVDMPKNDWATFTLDYSEYTSSNVIEIYTYFGNTDTAPIIYLAWVMGESAEI